LDEKTQQQLAGIATSLHDLWQNLVEVGKMAFDGWGHIFGFFMESGGSNIVLARIQHMIDAMNSLLNAILSLKNGDMGAALTHLKGAVQSSFNASPFGMVNDIANSGRADAISQYASAGYTVPDYLLKKNPDLTGDMLKDRITRISNAGATGNITFGNVEVKIDVSGGLDTSNSEQIGKQIAQQFMREMEKTQIQFSETN